MPLSQLKFFRGAARCYRGARDAIEAAREGATEAGKEGAKEAARDDGGDVSLGNIF